MIDVVVTVDQPDIASGTDGRWTAVWRRKRSENGFELYASQSTDLGATWSEPRLVFRTTNRYVRTPRIVAGSDGHWAVVFQYGESEQSDGQLYITHSVDDVVTWSEPMRFDNEMRTYQFLQGRVEITVSTSGEWLATWANRERGTLASISRDEGRSWSIPREIPPNGRSWDVDVAAMPGGRWLIAYGGIHLSVSSDGVTWSELPPITPEEGALGLYAPTLSFDPDGLLLLSYKQNFDVVVIPDEGTVWSERRSAQRSSDGGLTWMPASELFVGHGQSWGSGTSEADTHTPSLGPDDWLVLYGGLGKRSTGGGEWLTVERPSGIFDRVASDGFGNSIGIRDAGFAGSFIETMHFGLPSARNAVADDSGPGSQDSAAPGFPCPLAAVVLLAAGPVILLAGRRGKVH